MRSTILSRPAIGPLMFVSVVISLSSLMQPLAAQTPRPSGTTSSNRQTPTVLAIRRASPAVVNIHGQKTVRATAAGMAGATGPDSFRQVNGMGTGVIIDPRGYVITNYHVVEDVDEILVTLDDGSTTTADLVSARVRNDLALIKVSVNRELPTIPRGTSSDLMVGESVIAIGNAFGYVHTSTEGIISALHRDVPVNETQEYSDLIQISAGINPGNSGGPLLNIDGEIIGINVAVRVGAQQIAFAIPVDQVVEIVTEMIDDHNEQRLLTGLRTNGGPRDGDGVTVAHVSASSPAARDGLKPGDRVVRVGSRPIDDRLDFALALLGVTPGEPLELAVERSGRQVDVAMQFDAAPRQASAATVEELAWSAIGIQARPVAESTIRRLNARMRTSYRGGLYITAVRPGSPADQQSIVPGDVMIGIHGWQTSNLADLAEIFDHPDMQRGPRAKFFIVRQEQTLFGHMQLAAQSGVKRR
ncbi:trypsin-like peptidase domain-containing protein [Novipirellula artificiosorum]|uniref:Putative periplasmic serine endoprotease DegP-like n=1 Tax=Novipirellula artificiosorum TaxID=2528016 RepID=A0A5C6DM72_9BACT|nr:trypsin-like peptidase domain-containing protein [Novipirellula artificiosorum]TWU36016.1 putative periplasmic serine endoprotease DegP-like precursor [Novipirellula artificiosorum]